MIDRFIEELRVELGASDVSDDGIIDHYLKLYDIYIHKGQSEFDIIRHFGEPKEIVANYKITNELPAPDMDVMMDFQMPSYLVETKENTVDENTHDVEEVKEVNNLPTTRAGLVCNDIFFVGLGLLVAIAGCIAVLGVSIFMTAGAVVQLWEVWKLPTTGQQVGGFFLALMVLVMCAFFYFLVVWMTKIVVKYMKKYVRFHKENWDKCTK